MILNQGNGTGQDKLTFEGNVIDNVTSQLRLYQVIKEPTHILGTSSSSCIDFIFTSLLCLVIDSGIHLSLHPNCHHQIVYDKFNLEITYPPSLREVWHYKDTNIELIRRAISGFDWTRAFSNTRDNEKINIFNIAILNILSNFIPQKTLTRDDKDPCSSIKK